MSAHNTHHGLNYKTALHVFYALIGLTFLTVLVAQIHLSPVFAIVVAMLIAGAKVSVVLWWYMHLKYEEKAFRVLGVVVVFTLIVVVVLTFSDYGFRETLFPK